MHDLLEAVTAITFKKLKKKTKKQKKSKKKQPKTASWTPQDLSPSREQSHLLTQHMDLQPCHCSGGPVKPSDLGISREDNRQDLFAE